jgi:nucleoid-associated protein YgaU
MYRRTNVTLWLVIAMILALGAGCSSYKPKPIDISQGEYYEEEEYQKLSKKDRSAYCSQLAEELDNLKARSEKAESELTQNKEKIRTLTKDLRDAEREYSALTAQIDELTRQKEELEALPKTWVLQYGECLWIVAGYEEIYGDPLKWPRLWRGNKPLVEDPDWVLAGWELKIPRTWPKKHVVVQDEWLAKIAGYWEIYDNYRQWPLLYEANKSAISDPDLIFPEQELVVPR